MPSVAPPRKQTVPAGRKRVCTRGSPFPSSLERLPLHSSPDRASRSRTFSPASTSMSAPTTRLFQAPHRRSERTSARRGLLPCREHLGRAAVYVLDVVPIPGSANRGCATRDPAQRPPFLAGVLPDTTIAAALAWSARALPRDDELGAGMTDNVQSGDPVRSADHRLWPSAT